MSRRVVAYVIVTAAAAALVAAPTFAKEGVVARVLTPIERDAQAGTKLTVVWTLSSVEGGKRRPFGAGGVFIRLFGADGARSPRVYASQIGSGRYRAQVRVHRGGVQRVVIGLMSMRCAGSCRPAPRLFPLVGAVFR